MIEPLHTQADRKRPVSIGYLAGTVLLAVATSIVISAGCVALWLTLLYKFPLPVGIVALIGLGCAPIILMLDLIHIDRRENRS